MLTLHGLPCTNFVAQAKLRTPVKTSNAYQSASLRKHAYCYTQTRKFLKNNWQSYLFTQGTQGPAQSFISFAHCKRCAGLVYMLREVQPLTAEKWAVKMKYSNTTFQTRMILQLC